MLDEYTQRITAFFVEGGWPMVPLAVCSVAALAVILERAFALRRGRVIAPPVLDVIDTYRGEGSLDHALATVHRKRGAFSRIIAEMLHARGDEYPQLIETIHAAGRREVEKLDRGLIVLEIVAGISPLLGLLGTVLGMVTVFDAVAEQGLGDPQVLSRGISQALITTVAGLCVAIPALAFHSYYARRVESLSVEMQDLALAFAGKLRARSSAPAAASAPPIAAAARMDDA